MNISRSPTIQSMIEQRKSLFQGSFQVFKTSIVSFPPKAPEDTNRCNFPNNSTPWFARWLPTCKQVNNLSRHNPRHAETAKERIPYNRSHVAVEKDVSWFLKMMFGSFILENDVSWLKSPLPLMRSLWNISLYQCTFMEI